MAKQLKHSSLVQHLSVGQNNNYMPPQFGAGNFHKLPLEIIFMTFDQLDIPSLGNLAMTSNMIHFSICHYIKTKNGLKKLFNLRKNEVCSIHGSCFPEENVINAAKFLRKLVLFLPCKAKISFVSELLLKSSCIWNKDCFQLNMCFGYFVQVLSEGWAESEMQLAHDIMDQTSGRLNALNTVLVAKEGSMPEEEIKVRLYYRSVYWSAVQDPCKRGKWLNLILKGQPYCFQAKILLLMFAPTSADDNIMWDIFTSDQAPDLRITLVIAISEMANALLVLHLSNEMSLKAVVALIDEISEYPVEWRRQNVCQLILSCDSGVLQYILRRYMIGQHHDLFMYFISMCTLLPMCPVPPTLFAEMVFCTVHCSELSPAAHTSFVIYFDAFVNRYRFTFGNNRAMQMLVKLFRRCFPRRRSQRLASKVFSNK